MPLQCLSASDGKVDAASARASCKPAASPGRSFRAYRRLGSVDAEVSVRERFAFWARFPIVARLANRVGNDEHPKIYGALHARIPMVTPDEQRAIQEENAKDDERFWDALRDLNASESKVKSN